MTYFGGSPYRVNVNIYGGVGGYNKYIIRTVPLPYRDIIYRGVCDYCAIVIALCF